MILLLQGSYSISVAVWGLRKFIAIGFLRRRGSNVAVLSIKLAVFTLQGHI